MTEKNQPAKVTKLLPKHRLDGCFVTVVLPFHYGKISTTGTAARPGPVQQTSDFREYYA